MNTTNPTKAELLATNLTDCLTPNLEVLHGLLATFKPEVKEHIRATNQSPLDVALTLVCMMSEYTANFAEAFNLMFGADSWDKFLRTTLEVKLSN